ncbi:hypothetical protein BSL78_21778 [Apostichopus japonicus]|uniref:Transposable element P transposase-like RNase H domain-containing protein n=1 Tax=Stichopus japonicus TaxID=307972 RepID=A0A2G8K039_STIJA|nr:hypothetical protein BSL78_21778 [Apostichopus japonicus]
MTRDGSIIKVQFSNKSRIYNGRLDHVRNESWTSTSNTIRQGTSAPPASWDNQKTVDNLRTRLRRVRKEKRELLKAKHRQRRKLCKIFSVDQLTSLGRSSTRGVRWGDATVKKALQLRFTCGASGYDLLLRQNLPYPSIRTLQRRMQNVAFRPGILSQVFEFLELKVSNMRPEERICSLTLDEMALSTSIEYDVSSGRLLGDVTLPDHSGTATHALVFMIGGSPLDGSKPLHIIILAIPGMVMYFNH